MSTEKKELLTLIATIEQPETGAEFELTLEGVDKEVDLSYCVGTVVQRLTDYMRLHKRNNSRLLDARKDILISVSIIADGERVEWIGAKVMQSFRFKYRASASEKGAKRLASRVWDVVQFGATRFAYVKHTDVK